MTARSHWRLCTTRVSAVSSNRPCAPVRERYGKLAELSHDQIFIVDRGGNVEYVNRTAAEQFGIEPEQLVGRPVKDLFPPETVKRQAASLQQVFITGQPLHREGPTAFPDRETWLDTWLVPLCDEPGQVRAVLGVSRDLTERKELEQRLAYAERMEAVGQLAGGIAHDFNNLLTAIQGYSEMILEQISPDKPLWGDLREIQKASDQAATLVQRLLAFSRRQLLQLAVLDLNTVVQETKELLERVVGVDIAIEARLATDLNPVKIDAMELKQILLNLASNARDGMPSGGRMLIETQNVEILPNEISHLTPMAPPPGRYVVLRVTDTGVGMDEGTKA